MLTKLIDNVKSRVLNDYNTMVVSGNYTKANTCIINVGLVKGTFIVVANLIVNDAWHTNVKLAEFAASGKTLSEALKNLIHEDTRIYYC